MADDESNFFSRWSRRKAGARAGLPPVAEVTVDAVPTAPAQTEAALEVPAVAKQPELPSAAPAPPPAPTMADVALLTRDSDYARFVAADVSPEVKNAALKQLFSDPHYNVMDGLDIYIGDYNTPDPLPAGMLRKMVQSQLLGLFDDEEQDAKPGEPAAAEPLAATASTTTPNVPPISAEPATGAAHEDTDLQLQPDDGAGRPGPEPRPGADAGRPD